MGVELYSAELQREDDCQGPAGGELTAGGRDEVAMVICTLTVLTDKLHTIPWSFMCKLFKGITCTRGKGAEHMTPGTQCISKTMRRNANRCCAGAVGRNTQQFGGRVLCHADSQPGAARVDQKATSSQKDDVR